MYEMDNSKVHFGLFFVVLLADLALAQEIFPNLPVGVPDSASGQCRKDSDLFVSSLENLTLWAQEMWDATSKSSTGVLRGNIFQMGHFEQCISARAPFLTKHCMVQLSAKVPRPGGRTDELSLYFDPSDTVLHRIYKYKDITQQSRQIIRVGWCIPASCSSSDLQNSLNSYLETVEHHLKQDKNVSFSAQVDDLFCQASDEFQHYTSADISFILITAILVGCVLICTFVDMKSLNPDKDIEKKPKKNLKLQSYIEAFSAYRNFWDLNKKDNHNPALAIFYGMRTICIGMIIIDHRFGTFVSSALTNFDYIEQQYRAPLACIIFHGDLFVDSFFILSGLLAIYTLLGQYEKKFVNPGMIIFFRYVRLTPVYAYVVFYYATVFQYTGNGPLWKVIAGQDAEDCKANWWANLLYINNYVHPDHICMTHSWFLPCDFHYFIIGLLICILITKRKILGLGALSFITLLSIVIPFVLTVVYQRPAMLYFYPDFLTGPKVHPDYLLTYSKSHTRATPYFVGAFAGYVYYRLKGKGNIHLNRTKSVMIILASIALILTSILTGGIFYDPYHEYNVIEAGAYAALHRPAWALGSLGLLYVASYGHCNFIYKILTWSPWVPLSKLVYSAYLIHMQFQLRSAAKFMNSRHFDYFDVISLGISDIVVAFVSALLLYLTIEAPFRIIFRNLLMPKRDNVATAANKQTNNNLETMNDLPDSNQAIARSQDSRL